MPERSCAGRQALSPFLTSPHLACPLAFRCVQQARGEHAERVPQRGHVREAEPHQRGDVRRRVQVGCWLAGGGGGVSLAHSGATIHCYAGLPGLALAPDLFASRHRTHTPCSPPCRARDRDTGEICALKKVGGGEGEERWFDTAGRQGGFAVLCSAARAAAAAGRPAGDPGRERVRARAVAVVRWLGTSTLCAAAAVCFRCCACALPDHSVPLLDLCVCGCDVSPAQIKLDPIFETASAAPQHHPHGTTSHHTDYPPPIPCTSHLPPLPSLHLSHRATHPQGNPPTHQGPPSTALPIHLIGSFIGYCWIPVLAPLPQVKLEKERDGFPLTSIREINILLRCAGPRPAFVLHRHGRRTGSRGRWGRGTTAFLLPGPAAGASGNGRRARGGASWRVATEQASPACARATAPTPPPPLAAPSRSPAARPLPAA